MTWSLACLGRSTVLVRVLARPKKKAIDDELLPKLQVGFEFYPEQKDQTIGRWQPLQSPLSNMDLRRPLRQFGDKIVYLKTISRLLSALLLLLSLTARWIKKR